jgi:hypothetical protein
MNTLKTLKRVTRKLALHFALNPTATMIQAPNPTMETMTRAKDHDPWKINPMKRKISRIRPANWKLSISTDPRSLSGEAGTHYFLLSVSLRDGIPAKSFFLFWRESERTISKPPTTLRFRRKNERSNRSP